MAETEMVERVAKAVEAATSTHIHRPYDMTTCRIIARAAITAMREPTEAMEDAGRDALCQDEFPEVHAPEAKGCFYE